MTEHTSRNSIARRDRNRVGLRIKPDKIKEVLNGDRVGSAVRSLDSFDMVNDIGRLT